MSTAAHSLACRAGLALSLSWAGIALAQGPTGAEPGGSRIEQVTVYPGLAAVLRSARVPAGARELVLDCLSPAFELASLQLEPDAGLRLGPVSALTRPRAEVPACQASPLDARIRALEDKLAALNAEAGGHDLVLAYLQGLGGSPATETAPATRDVALAGPLAATLAALQRAGQGALGEKHRLARDRETLERELAPLRAERERLQGGAGEVRQLRIALAASQEGRLRLRYQVSGPTWAPAYRAALDPVAGQIEVERLAQVSQRSGEDWSGVALRLSTGSPRAATSGPLPRPWTLTPRPPVAAEMAPRAALAAPAPVPMRLAKAAADAEAPLDFAVQVSEGAFATEFEVPGTVSVGSGAQHVSLSLSSQRWPATVRVQTTPQADASAWVVAEVAAPEGVWPDGPLQLLRGGQAVGQGVWRAGTRDRLSLSFGRDELVRVQIRPVPQTTASSGFIGTRSERRVSHVYEVENRHRTPIELEVLESSPVATDAQIQVERRLEPPAALERWQDQPGVLAWRQRLEAGRSARFSADYLISHPKDLPVVERR